MAFATAMWLVAPWKANGARRLWPPINAVWTHQPIKRETEISFQVGPGCQEPLVASLLLVAMPFVPSSVFVFLLGKLRHT